jgi:hypothetical protein
MNAEPTRLVSGDMLTRLAGRVTLLPGRAQPLVCSRPLADATVLSRLVQWHSAAEIPDLLGSLFALCAEPHRATAARAIRAAQHNGCGEYPRAYVQSRQDAETEAAGLRAVCLREHLRFFAVGVPARAQLGELMQIAEEQLLGSTAQHWIERYGAFHTSAVAAWAAAYSGHLLPALWLDSMRDHARRVALDIDGRSLLDDARSDLPLLAHAMRRDTAFAAHAHHRDRPCETGAFARAAWPRELRTARSAYDLLAARIVDVAQLCHNPRHLQSGAMSLGPGAAIAYSELARGLLVHYVQLALPDLSVVEDYRVVTPTDFALHPEGAFASTLRRPTLDAQDVDCLIAAFDPCLEIEVQGPACTS